jgi:hypothetical protein
MREKMLPYRQRRKICAVFVYPGEAINTSTGGISHGKSYFDY